MLLAGFLRQEAKRHQWLELETCDGFRAGPLDYWIKGKRRAERPPRCNLFDVLLAAQYG